MAQPAPLPNVGSGTQRVSVVNLTPTSVGANATSIQTFTVNGLDPIAHQFLDISQFAWSSGAQTQTTGIFVQAAWVSAANTLSIAFQNTTGGSLTPAAGYYSLVIF